MSIISDLQKDSRVIRKFIGKRFQTLKGGDIVMNGIGILLVGTMFATVIFQKDIAREGVEKWSPFRYDNPNSVWYEAYQIIEKTNLLKKKEKSGSEERRK